MSKLENNRVLNRMGARELTMPEAEFVCGAAAFNTLVCTLPAFNASTHTHTGGDGDGCTDTDSGNS